MNELIMAFDVESVGKHGPGFAVGWVVVDKNGIELEERYLASYTEAWLNTVELGNSREDRAWVKENVLPALSGSNCRDLFEVRDYFWQSWLKWRDRGALLVADCSWPVETNFLATCVKHHPTRREQGPYPLHDVSTALLMAGKDPLLSYDRLPNELPKHHPTCDARQSARLFREARSTVAIALPGGAIK